MSPGPVSDSATGRQDWHPYVPGYCYPNGPKMCPCGHHEGFHLGPGSKCIHTSRHEKCGCTGLPASSYTTNDEFDGKAEGRS